MSRGLEEAADMAEKEMEKYQDLLECATMRRNYPDKPQTDITPISGNPVPERDD